MDCLDQRALPMSIVLQSEYFRSRLKHDLLLRELIIADITYQDCKCRTQQSTRLRRPYKIVRARNETYNQRLKHFSVLIQRFRHWIGKHAFCFRAVSNLPQPMIQNRHNLFSLQKFINNRHHYDNFRTSQNLCTVFCPISSSLAWIEFF